MTCFWRLDRNNWVLASGHRNRLDIIRGIEIDLMPVMGSNITCFFMCEIEIDLVLASGSKLTFFSCGGQSRLQFCVRAGNFLVFVYGSKLTRFLA